MKRDNLYCLFFKVFSLVTATWGAYWLFLVLWIPNDPLGETAAERGQFGDMFGGLNALFTGLTLAALVITLKLQRESNELAAKTFEASMLLKVHDEFASDEMLKAMKTLGDFARAKGDDFARQFGVRRANNEMYDREIETVDRARRKFKMFFHRLYFLAHQHVIGDEFIRDLMAPTSIGLLLDVVEPLEKVVSLSSAAEQQKFDFFRSLYSKEIRSGETKFLLPDGIAPNTPEAR